MQHQQTQQPTLSEQVTSFTHELFGELRTLTDQEGNPWFVAKDVAMALGYKVGHKMLAHVDEMDKGSSKLDTPWGKQGYTIINESGFYSAILRSKKSAAKVFKRWVTSEVLPSIRKHGGYTIGQEDISPEELAIRAMSALRSKLEEKEQQLAQQQPKVDFVDNYVDSRGTECLQDTAKLCGVRPRSFNAALEGKGILMRNGKGTHSCSALGGMQDKQVLHIAEVSYQNPKTTLCRMATGRT